MAHTHCLSYECLLAKIFPMYPSCGLDIVHHLVRTWLQRPLSNKLDRPASNGCPVLANRVETLRLALWVQTMNQCQPTGRPIRSGEAAAHFLGMGSRRHLQTLPGHLVQRIVYGCFSVKMIPNVSSPVISQWQILHWSLRRPPCHLTPYVPPSP